LKTPDANYYHKVVDCQWACPAHTPVPEYIRLIAEGRYADAYMVNRESNVFPGVLGRVCDRPCEPACRRGRIDEKPVAICRLKRVAADLKGDIRARLPKVPTKKNGRKIALIGSGPASLTVANDLLPLGYELDLFEKDRLAGGAMRSSVPLFRLPADVLDDEISMIVERGVNLYLNRPVKSMRELMAAGYDAVFVGSGAPVGRDLALAGRDKGAAHIHVGLQWLANIAFEHAQPTKTRVLVIGGGNTAMDCCRSAKRLGASKVDVVAPEAFDEMLASPWEKEESLEEGIEFHNHLLPLEFIVGDQGQLTGVRFQHLRSCYNAQRQWAPVPSGSADVIIQCDEVILAVGQNTAFPFIERDIGIDFVNGRDLAIVDPISFQSTHERVFFGGDAAFGPKNIIWAVAHGHDAALSVHSVLEGKNPKQRPQVTMKLSSQKMGLHEWSYDQSYAADRRVSVPHVGLEKRFEKISLEVELGFDAKQALTEAGRCLNCDVQTVFSESQCIECDACVDICPVQCLTMTPQAPIEELVKTLSAPALRYPQQDLLISAPLPDTARLMVKDEDICLHCGLCAERCPTGAWDMQKAVLNIPKVGCAT
jgi:formate dehydrogenase beta subunit